MTPTEFRSLKPGDFVVNEGSRGHVYIVTMNYGTRATAVHTVDMTNPSEWNLIKMKEKREEKLYDPEA